MERAATAAANSIVLAVENIASSRDRVFWLNRYYAGINPCPWARVLRLDRGAGTREGLYGRRAVLRRAVPAYRNSRCEARSAPSRRLASLAQTTSSATRPQPAAVSKPQSWAGTP